MKTQAIELDRQVYDMDNMCNSCSNPLPIFDKIIVTIGNNKYYSPICTKCLDEKGINYEK